jgi:NADPH:quinone reductase-like Zn-dependent oxidoreductase
MIATATGTKMKAIVCEKPGPLDRLKVTEIDRPDLSRDDVLVRVHASSANPVDMFPTTMAGYLLGGRKPAVLGTDFAGTVEEVGSDVTDFRVGDEVFGGKGGAFAEFLVAAPKTAIARKPASVSFELAGTVAVAGTTALQALRNHGGVKAGQRVLINGASGGVGTFAVQIARALGAEVTAVCSARNVDLVRSLGAADVIDYAEEDFTKGSERFDLIVDVASSHSFASCRRVLEPNGTYVVTGAAAVQHRRAGLLRAMGHFLVTRITAIGLTQKVVSLFIASLNRDDMAILGEMLESGKIVPAIDRCYDLAAVPEALQYLNEGHARAKVAIRVR